MNGISRYLVLSILLVFISVNLASASVVGTSSIYAPAVLIQNNSGSLTKFSLVVTTGNGNVKITGPISVANSTLESAQTAIMYAASYLNLNYSKYNFSYTIGDMNQSVSGPSAGAAMTLLAISALSNKPLRNNFTITGTISSNGTIGEIGGVYNKAGAAERGGMTFMLVPEVPSQTQEDELYYLVQTNFDIPLIQVANITQAYQYALQNKSISNAGTYYDFYTNYNANLLTSPNITCSNGCSFSPFSSLLNVTLNSTNSAVSQLSQPKFNNVTNQLSNEADESKTIAEKGFLYAAADLSFLNYINAYFFSSHNATIQSAENTMQSEYNYCTSLSAPQLTQSNYEWVLAGELRQTWGSYTLSSTISEFNSNVSDIDSDTVLVSLYSNAESTGWCNAANFMYQIAANMGGKTVVVSQNLGPIALGRINRASELGTTMYLQTAQTAYSDSNYPLAILDSDYSYSLLSAAAQSGLTTSQLDSMALSMSLNSTYGAWPAQFADEAEFYIQESKLTANSTQAHTYATEAYSSALLAQQLSNDTSIIYSNISPGSPTSTVVPTTVVTTIPYQFASRGLALVWIVIAILVIVDIVVLILIAALFSKFSAKSKIPQRTRKRNTRR